MIFPNDCVMSVLGLCTRRRSGTGTPTFSPDRDVWTSGGIDEDEGAAVELRPLHNRPMLRQSRPDCSSAAQVGLIRRGSSSRRVHKSFRALTGHGLSLFFFFFISHFVPPHTGDPSNRILQGIFQTLRPFIELGFDGLMWNRKILDKYTRTSHLRMHRAHRKAIVGYDV
ncbi:hypothetical protein BJV78DRAFT_591050 [Lactifluus subvellereus]|nr:hypothetical protein BJV78DRAFT_591050 [Lactifluus subvellereus]